MKKKQNHWKIIEKKDWNTHVISWDYIIDGWTLLAWLEERNKSMLNREMIVRFLMVLGMFANDELCD